MTAGIVAAGARGQSWGVMGGAALAVALLAIPFMLIAVLAGLSGALPGADSPGADSGDGVSALARADIPSQYLRYYQHAAQRYGLDWAILAAIGRVECDHGRDSDPSCTRQGAVNGAGAGGPMQFIADFAGVALGGVGAWCLTAPLVGTALYFVLRPPLRLLAARTVGNRKLP